MNVSLSPVPFHRRLSRQAAGFWFGLAVIILAGLVLRAWLLYSFPLSPDEGIHLNWLRLLSAGYQPYRDVYITYPPLYPLAIQGIWELWPTEAAQRWFSVIWTLFGAVGTALLARRFAGPVAGLVAAGLILSSPVLMEPSRAVLAEFPSVAWSVWAIWLAWLAGEGSWRRRLHLALSGLCLAVSLLTKLLSPFVVALIPIILGVKLWQEANQRISESANSEDRERSSRVDKLPGSSRLLSTVYTRLASAGRLLPALAVWGTALVVPALALLLAFEPGALVRQVVDQRLEARAAYTADEAFWPPRIERGTMFAREDAALVALGLAGLILALARRHKDTGLLLAWLALALAMLAVHNPIRYKHFLILIPPLAVFGGLAVNLLIYDLRFTIYDLRYTIRDRVTHATRSTHHVSAHRLPLGRFTACTRFWGVHASRFTLSLAGLLFLLALYIYQIPAALALWAEKAAVPQPPPEEVEALAFIADVTAPDDCLITDDAQLLYWSGRLTPPELAEVSTNRLKSGVLTLAELVEVTDQYDCQVVAPISNRLTKYLPDYVTWMRGKYLGRFRFGEDELYVAKTDTEPRPEVPLQANFADQVLLHGYNLPAGPYSPGARLPLTLVWQAQAEMAADYAIFIQLRGADPAAAATILVSADHQPYRGLVPTSAWRAGGVVSEVTWLALPADLKPGAYPLYVGLYTPATLERLPLLGDRSGENAVVLGPVVVQ